VDQQPPLRAVIERFELRADKRLGQHFLLDANLLRRIAAAAGELAGRTVVEVGPGPGGLTRALLEAGAGRVIAIERDARCIRALGGLVEAAAGRLCLIEADALALDLADLSPGRVAVVANLPYNVGTALLLRWLDQLERIERLTLMFQREVALRIAAPPERGRANEELVTLLARTLRVPRSSVRVARGHTTGQKLVEVQRLTREEAERRLVSAREERA